jgi:hypothetical protein
MWSTGPTFLILALYGGERSASRPDRFSAGQEPSVTTRLGGPQSRSGRSEEKNLVRAGNRTQTVQPVTMLTALSRLSFPHEPYIINPPATVTNQN